jgi:hypothetical protein
MQAEAVVIPHAAVNSSTITKVHSMKEVSEYLNTANSRTLVIFDIDMVLVQPSDPAFQMANMKRYGAISKRIMRELSAQQHMMLLSLMTINSESILVDEGTPMLLKSLVQREIPAIALTANFTGSFGHIKNMAEWRVNTLKLLGINFAKAAPYQKALVFNNLPSYRGNYSAYLDGVIFSNGLTVSKGDAFLSFVQKAEFLPERVIFIDDREDNLESLRVAIQKLSQPIAYQGLHFLGAEKYPSKKISEEEFESSWQQLVLQVKQLD